MKLGDLIKVRQRFDDSHVGDVEATLLKELASLDLKIEKGARIAVTAGSRGIDDIPAVLRTVAGFIRSRGGDPFFVPAMGSHGGATAEGQVKILQNLGITEDIVGAPILASMEAVELDRLDVTGCMDNGASGLMPVYMDRYAFEADGIIAVNRIKPHTSFHSDFESGLMKMLVVGLGKELQATAIHNYGPSGLRNLIAPAARRVLVTGKVLAGIGLVENAYDRLSCIRAFEPGDIEAGEKELLDLARRSMPSLPAEQLDVLVVDEIGKNYSGTGMDTNIIGRIRIDGEPEPIAPRIKKIAVLGLSRKAEGNAYGIGLADVTTRQLLESIDYRATYANALATNYLERVRLPLIMENADEAFELALRLCKLSNPEEARVIRVKNTLQLESLEVSESLYEEIKDRVEKVR